MKLIIVLLAMILMPAAEAHAQFGNIRKKVNEIKPKQEQPKKDEQSSEASEADATPLRPGPGRKDQYEDREFLLMGRNDLNGKSIPTMKACVHGGTSQRQHPPMSERFIAWSTSIDETAALKSFEMQTCHVIAFFVNGGPGSKYNSIDTLTETAQGNSIYKVDGDKLVLVRAIAASEFYIVVAAEQSKPGLKLADLKICGYPDTIKLFKRMVHTGSYCHDQAQKLYVFEKYKSYPGPLQTSSVIFDAAEFEDLKRRGMFKGLASYKLVGEELVPIK